MAHAKDAKVGKEDWLLEIGERMAHVPHSRDALSRAKVAKPRRGCGAQTRVGKGGFDLEMRNVPRGCGTRLRAEFGI